jgi:hypothetical protein
MDIKGELSSGLHGRIIKNKTKGGGENKKATEKGDKFGDDQKDIQKYVRIAYPPSRGSHRRFKPACSASPP